MSKIILSEDGSHTLISEEFRVTYHSSHGSLQESNTIFIHAGLKYLLDKGYEKISIFEMGFGSGLNALLALLFCKENGTLISYTGIEAYPIPIETAAQLNFPEILQLNAEEAQCFHQMHSKEGLNFGHFAFQKRIGKIEEFQDDSTYDIIFYDAFSPESQPHLWQDEIIRKMFSILNPGGILVTYCAKGAFKRVLKGAGFQVEGLPGPIGKREITRASKPLIPNI